MSEPSDHLLKRARDLSSRMPNKVLLVRNLQKEGHDAETVRAAVDQIFAERSARKRANALHEQAVSRLLSGEELDEEAKADELKPVAVRRRAKLEDARRAFARKRYYALLSLVATLALPLWGLITGSWRGVFHGLPVLFVGSISWLGYAFRMHSHYSRQVHTLDELAERYGWWGMEGPGE